MAEREIVIADPHGKEWPGRPYGARKTDAPRAFVFWYGACAPSYVLCYGDLDSALETFGEYLAEHAPGEIMLHGSDEHTQLVKDACEDAGLAWPMPDNPWDDEAYVRAIESAESDLTYTESGWITSYEWGIALENPTKDELIAFAHGDGR
jgi:hypothetical protein